MKKYIICGLFVIIAALGLNITTCKTYATGNVFKAVGRTGQDESAKTYTVGVKGATKLQGDQLIDDIKTAINWVLGMLSLVALALCLRGGFQMMTSGGDSKKYESGINLLKWAGIGLAVIACSWLIVSLIFWIINGATGQTTS